MSHVPSASTSNVVDALVDSSIPKPNEIYIHEENQDNQQTEVESIPTDFSSSQSLKFLIMVQQISSSVFFF